MSDGGLGPGTIYWFIELTPGRRYGNRTMNNPRMSWKPLGTSVFDLYLTLLQTFQTFSCCCFVLFFSFAKDKDFYN